MAGRKDPKIQRRNREIARLYRTGEWTRQQLADQFGLAWQSINGILHRANVRKPRRRRG